MVTRRDMGVSFAPAKRAAVWPRPRREPGRWPARAPLPLDAGRRTEDLPLLALPACLRTLETKPWPRLFGALGRMRKASSRRSLLATFPVSSSVPDRAKHEDIDRKRVAEGKTGEERLDTGGSQPTKKK